MTLNATCIGRELDFKKSKNMQHKSISNQCHPHEMKADSINRGKGLESDPGNFKKMAQNCEDLVDIQRLMQIFFEL